MALKRRCRDCSVECKDVRCRACSLRHNRRKAAPLRRWCDVRGYTYEQLATETRLGIRTIRRIAAGEPAKSGRTALALNRVTKISLGELLRGTE